MLNVPEQVLSSSMASASDSGQRPRSNTEESQSTSPLRASQEAAPQALIEAWARNKDTPNEYENRVKKSRAGGIELIRVAEYLPSRIGKPNSGASAPKVSYFGALWKLCTGSFLTLTENYACEGPVDGIKQSVFDENVNLAVISALLLTLVVPMFFESWEDYLSEDFDGSGTLFIEGYIGSRLDENAVKVATRWLADIGHCFYLLSTGGFLFSTLASVYILLCVNEIGSDNGVSVFLRQMGAAIKLPYIFFSFGMVCFGAILLRCVFTVRSLEVLIIEMVGIVPMVSCFCFVSQIYCVQCTCHALHEIHNYEPLALTPAEVHEDVELYLQKAGPSAEMADCLFNLQARTPTGALVSLSSVTTALVKAAYHRKMLEWMGFEIPDSAIYQITRNAFE